jgi:O-antigen ligase
LSVKVRRGDLLNGENALEKLGISGWKHNRNWRYGGFYGQIITYAEVLQMIMSLAFGLFIAGLGNKIMSVNERAKLSAQEKSAGSFFQSLRFRISSVQVILCFCLAAMGFSLLMTFTRAAQIAFFVSVFSIILVNGNRKILAALAILILPIAIAGYFFIQQNRTINVDGKTDPSVGYRQTVYRESFGLWTRDARNFFLGVGMDSAKRFKEEWHLFDNGRLEASHFHSTPLQLLAERGLFAFLLWLWILWLYGRTLLKTLNFKSQNISLENESSKSLDWQTRGILLGCFGGLIGFFVSSLVNYSLGDSEVAMVFYLLMGIGVSLAIRIQNSRFRI